MSHYYHLTLIEREKILFFFCKRGIDLQNCRKDREEQIDNIT